MSLGCRFEAVKCKSETRPWVFTRLPQGSDPLRLPLRPEIAKNKDGRVVILVGELANLIDRRRAERVESCPYVFHRQGQPIKDYSRAEAVFTNTHDFQIRFMG